MPGELYLEIVTAERLLYSGPVTLISAPAADGRVGILPGHASLLTALLPGELRLRPRGDDEQISIAISGGFLEVSNDRAIILARSAERAVEIDVERAFQARERAVKRLQERSAAIDTERARAAAARAEARLRVAERYRQAHPGEGR